MSFQITNRKQNKRTVRTWFRCDECRGWGDMTTKTAEAADEILARFNERHECAVEVSA